MLLATDFMYSYVTYEVTGLVFDYSEVITTSSTYVGCRYEDIIT